MSEQRALFFVRKGEDDTNEFHLSLCDRRDGVQRPAYTFPQGLSQREWNLKCLDSTHRRGPAAWRVNRRWQTFGAPRVKFRD